MIRNQAGQRVTFSLYFEGELVLNPTLAAADFGLDIDGGGQNPLAVLPTSDAAGLVAWLPTAAETDGRYVSVVISDVSVIAEWDPVTMVFDTLDATTIVTNLDVTVGSRATQAQILSDLTPFDGANVDAAISSRPTLAQFFNTDSTEVQPGIPGSVVHEILDGINTVAFPAGAIDFTYTVTDSTTGLPVEGAEVWFATDAAFANIVWKGDTDAFGIAQDVAGDLPRLDAGTYYIRVQRAGYAAMDDVEVVS